MTERLSRYNLTMEECFKYIKEFGYDGVDITLFDKFKNYEPNKEILCRRDYLKHAKELKKVADKLNLKIVQSHTPFPIHIDNNNKYNKEMLEIQKRCIRVCGILGVKNVVIHPWNNWDYVQNKKFYDGLLPLAKKCKVNIVTENMWNLDKKRNRACKAACSHPDDFLKHCTYINDKNFGACVDIGHANMFQFDNVSPSKMIETLGKYVYCFHIHDNDGVHDNHAVPYTMKLDFDSIIKSIRKINYKGDLVVETNLDSNLPFNEFKKLCINQRKVMDKIRKQITR